MGENCLPQNCTLASRQVIHQSEATPSKLLQGYILVTSADSPPAFHFAAGGSVQSELSADVQSARRASSTRCSQAASTQGPSNGRPYVSEAETKEMIAL